MVHYPSNKSKHSIGILERKMKEYAFAGYEIILDFLEEEHDIEHFSTDDQSW
jgi:hypothetical protein